MVTPPATTTCEPRVIRSVQASDAFASQQWSPISISAPSSAASEVRQNVTPRPTRSPGRPVAKKRL